MNKFFNIYYFICSGYATAFIRLDFAAVPVASGLVLGYSNLPYTFVCTRMIRRTRRLLIESTTLLIRY